MLNKKIFYFLFSLLSFSKLIAQKEIFPENLENQIKVKEYKIKGLKLFHYLDVKNERKFRLEFSYKLENYEDLLLLRAAFDSENSNKLQRDLSKIKVQFLENISYIGNLDPTKFIFIGNKGDLEEALRVFRSFFDNFKFQSLDYKDCLDLNLRHLQDIKYPDFYYFLFEKNKLKDKYEIAAKKLSQKSPEELTKRFKSIINSSHEIYFYAKNLKNLKKNLKNYYKNLKISYLDKSLENEIIEFPIDRPGIYFYNYKKKGIINLTFFRRGQKISSLKEMLLLKFYNSFIDERVKQFYKKNPSFSLEIFLTSESLERKNTHPYFRYLLCNSGSRAVDSDQMSKSFKFFKDLIENPNFTKEELKLAKEKILNSERYKYNKNISRKESLTKKEKFQLIQSITFERFKKFYKEKIENEPYTWEIHLSKKDLEAKDLKFKKYKLVEVQN